MPLVGQGQGTENKVQSELSTAYPTISYHPPTRRGFLRASSQLEERNSSPSSPYFRTSGIGCCSQKRPDNILILALLDTFQISLFFLSFRARIYCMLSTPPHAPLHSPFSPLPGPLVLFVPPVSHLLSYNKYIHDFMYFYKIKKTKGICSLTGLICLIG